MGIAGEFENPDFIKIMDKIVNIGNKLDIVSGLHIVEPDADKLSKAISSGHKFIAYSVDIRMLDVMARRGIVEFNKMKK